MSEAAETLDGWYSLHLFYAVDWATFRLVPEDEREAMINEFKVFIENKATAREKQAGDYALYNITGQKADILLWYLRPEMKELNQIENEFKQFASDKLKHIESRILRNLRLDQYCLQGY